MSEFESLRKLYLEDLGKTVQYKHHSQPRPRVRHVGNWERIETLLVEGVAEPLILPPTDPTRQVWVWSDLHFGHENIIDFSNRPYPNTYYMNECLIENFRDYVGPDDISIWVGDVAFLQDTETNKLLDRCPGYKILVVGNHDFNKGKLRKLNFEEICILKHITLYGIDYVFTHYPMENLPKPYINVHGHIHVGGHRPDPTNLQHINVNCEFHNYKPITLTEIHRIGKLRVASMEE